MMDGLKVKPNAFCKAHTPFKIFDETLGAAGKIWPKVRWIGHSNARSLLNLAHLDQIWVMQAACPLILLICVLLC